MNESHRKKSEHNVSIEQNSTVFFSRKNDDDEDSLKANMIRFVEQPRFKLEIGQDGSKIVRIKHSR